MMTSVKDLILGLTHEHEMLFQNLSVMDVPGILIVMLASVIVVYAFYTAVRVSIWPAETDLSHIKYSVLEEGDDNAH